MPRSENHNKYRDGFDLGNTVSRRDFLIRTGLAAGALTLGPLAAAETAFASPTAHALDGVAEARALVQGARSRPVWAAPGPPFDAMKAKGKSIFYLPSSLSSPIIQVFLRGFKDATAPVGVTLTTIDAGGLTANFDRAMQTAISQKVDCIIIESIQPPLIAASIRDAHKAGIKVITVDYRDENAPKPLPEIDLNIGLPYSQAGRLLADWVVADSNGHVNALMVYPSDALAGVDVADATEAELKRLSPTAKVRRIGVTFPDRPQLGTRVLVELTRHPDINYIVGCFDSLTLQTQPSVALAASSGSKTAKNVKIVSFNAVSAVMKMLQKGQYVVGEVGSPNLWHAWAQIDAALRVMTGLPGIKSEGIKLRIFDRTNLGPKFNLDTPDENWYGPNHYKEVSDGFKKLWGVST